ncbi:ketopantoate reductase family protein [[Clostridium] innocuum]|uniref:ketopantoate reductase family protein n=1 Tax=Clostridium innocuum TaxID=1522 RepID=UPI00210D5721|nr:ketopantoate reductase family protein [[Clostridium] innocuum]MCQ4709123.1 ketopantoate reductase family protein [[Clostridium] innocuum]
MKIVMLGAGALGSTIGGTLAMGGNDVHFVDMWQEHVDLINKDGLHMTNEKEDWYVRVDARTTADTIGEADLVIVLVKSFATKQAVEQLKQTNVIGKNTMVMSLQNGLGNEETIASVIGSENVISGKTYVGGRLIQAGYISAGVQGKWTYIGELNGEITDRIQTVCNVFNDAGLLCEVSDNIKGLIWDKLLINVAAGALCGITRLPYGPLYEEDYIKDVAVAAIQEGIQVAKAAGVVLKSEDPQYPWVAASEGLPGTFKTSILQSLELKRPTEIDFINGSIVEWGKKYGIATPVNQTLVACVKGIEKYILKYEPSLKKG